MGIAYRADRLFGCTFAVWDGDIGPDDVTAHLLRLAEDPEWPPGPMHLSDLSTVKRLTIPDGELLSCLYEGTDFPDGLSGSFVVPPKFLDTADARRVASTNRHVKLFTDLPSACDHLGLSVAVVAAVNDELRRALTRRR
jgi:hypothetical protein